MVGTAMINQANIYMYHMCSSLYNIDDYLQWSSSFKKICMCLFLDPVYCELLNPNARLSNKHTKPSCFLWGHANFNFRTLLIYDKSKYSWDMKKKWICIRAITGSRTITYVQPESTKMQCVQQEVCQYIVQTHCQEMEWKSYGNKDWFIEQLTNE